MDIEKQNLLQEKFPLLYSTMFTAEEGKPFHCIQAFGIECGNGWFDILYNLSEKLEELITELPKDEQPFYHVDQIKEKYGGLRVYLSAETDEMYELISAAENESYKTCEGCGEPGHCNNVGWWATLCDTCRGFSLESNEILQFEVEDDDWEG